MNLRMLSDMELVRYARAHQDPLTSTELEDEMLVRLEKLETLGDLVDLVEEFDAAPDDVRQMLERAPNIVEGAAMLAELEQAEVTEAKHLKSIIALRDTLAESDIYDADGAKPVIAILQRLSREGIDSPAALDRLIDAANAFRSLASDAGDVFTRLAAMAEKSQE